MHFKKAAKILKELPIHFYGFAIIIFAAFMVLPLSAYVVVKQRADISADTPCAVAPTPAFGKKPDDIRAEKVAGELATDTQTIVENKNNIRKKAKEYRNKADERKKKLVEAMYRNPDKAFEQAIKKDNEDFAQSTNGCVEQKIELEGELHVVHADFFKEGKSDYRYQIKSGNKKYDLHFAKGQYFPIESGTKIKLKGLALDNEVLVNGSVPIEKGGDDGGVNLISQPGNPPVVGTQRTIAIRVRFQNTPSPLADYTDDELNRFLDQLRHHTQENSYNIADVSPDVYPGVIVLSRDEECASIPGVIAGMTLWEANTKVLLSNYDRVIIYSTQYLDCEYSGITEIGKRDWTTQSGTYKLSVAFIPIHSPNTYMTTVHEFGHMLGLDHAQSLECDTFVADRFSDCLRREYGESQSAMGSARAGHFDAVHKESIGWLDDSNIKKIDRDGDYLIRPIEQNLGTRAIKVPRGNDEYIYIEYRARYGEDYADGVEGGKIHIIGQYSPANSVDRHVGSYKSLVIRTDDQIFEPGEKITDVRTGTAIEFVKIDGAAPDSNLTVRVKFGGNPCGDSSVLGAKSGEVLATVSCASVPSATTTNMKVEWPAASGNGYLSAVARKQDVAWSPVTYVVSLRCTSDFYGCPADLGDKLTTTDTSGNITMANGFSYEYTVDIYTKKDGDPNQVARYFWVKKSKNNVSCSGGAATCSVSVSWPSATYRASLVKSGTDTKVCNGAAGCQDLIAQSSPTNASFRGLLAIDGNTDLEAKVDINDFSGNAHLLQRITGLGIPDDYFGSCSGQTGCTITTPAGIGPFVGNEPLLYSVKVGDKDGQIIEGPSSANAAANGSFTKSWSATGGGPYTALILENGLNCTDPNSECQIKENISTNSWIFGNLTPGVLYQKIVCAPNCGTGIKVYDQTETASVPTAARPKGVILNCANAQSIYAYFSWAAPAGAIYDSLYLDVSTSYDFAPGTFSGINVTGKVGYPPAADQSYPYPPDKTYYWRLNAHMVNGGWLPSFTQRFRTSCTATNAPAITCKDADVNRDGRVNSADRLLVATHYGHYPLYDVNGDGVVSSADSLWVLKLYGICP